MLSDDALRLPLEDAGAWELSDVETSHDMSVADHLGGRAKRPDDQLE